MADTESSQSNQQENQPSASDDQPTSHLAATPDSYQESTTLGDHDIEKLLMEGYLDEYGEFSSDQDLEPTGQKRQNQTPQNPELAELSPSPVIVPLEPRRNRWFMQPNVWIVAITIVFLIILMGIASYFLMSKTLRPTSTEQNPLPTKF